MAKLESQPHVPSDAQRTEMSLDFSLQRALASEYVREYGINAPDGFQGISIDELADLDAKILRVKNVFQAYDLLAEYPRSGSLCWYDRIISPQHKRIYGLVHSALKMLITTPEQTGVDLGAGSGNVSTVLARFCRSVTAMDLSMPLLRVAGSKLEKIKRTRQLNMKSYNLVRYDITNLISYKPNSFNLATGIAVLSYMDIDEAMEYYRGIHTILKPGGRYIEYLHLAQPEPKIYSTSPRAVLVGTIAGHIFGYSNVTKIRSKGPEYHDIPTETGLQTYRLDIREQGVVNPQEWIQILEKPL